MKGKKALGIIETYGLTSAVEAADTAVKAANVVLIGYELARGSGLTTVKVVGDVGSVKAAMSAAEASVSKIGKVVAVHVIPRPHDDIDVLMQPEKSYAEKGKREEQEEVQAEVQAEDGQGGADGEPQEEEQVTVEQDEVVEEKYSCNLCKDPKCPRKKGEPRVNCIHFEEEN